MSIYNDFVFLKGNLGKPAEIKETSAGTVARFSLAIYQKGKGDGAVTSWETIIAWHDLSRGMAEMEKGARLIVIGSMQTRSYETNDGVKKYITEVIAREIGRDISIGKEDNGEAGEEDPF